MKKIFLMMISMFLLSSCATIVHGPTQKVTFTTKSNQEIVVRDQYGNIFAKGYGKLELELPKSSGNDFINGAKYNKFTATTKTDTKTIIPFYNAAYYFGNMFTFGIGYIVDDYNGSGVTFEHNGRKATTINLE